MNAKTLITQSSMISTVSGVPLNAYTRYKKTLMILLLTLINLFQKQLSLLGVHRGMNPSVTNVNWLIHQQAAWQEV
jgi:hypothetical protein